MTFGRFHRRRDPRVRRRLPSSATGLLLVALAMGGCQGGSSTNKPMKSGDTIPAVPKAGECYEDRQEYRVGVDFELKVSCKKKHLFEVTGVVKIPAKFAKGTTKRELVAARERIGASSDEALTGSPFQQFMDRACSKAALKISGLEDLKLITRRGGDAHATPVVSSGFYEWSLATVDQWLDGHRVGLCLLRFDEDEDMDNNRYDGVASTTSGPLIKQMLKSHMPASKRHCVNFADDYVERGSCRRPHDAEALLNYEIDAMFGAGFSDDIDVSEELSDAQYHAMVAPCEDALDQIVGPADPELFADVIYGDWQWSEVPGRRFVTCLVTTDVNLRLPKGSVIGDGKGVKLRPPAKPRSENTVV